MKKLLFLGLIACLGLVACIETESNTNVNADGSGTSVTVVDMSQMMGFLAASKSEEKKKEEFRIDSVIYFKSVTDTAASLTGRQKQLLEPMQFRIQMNSDNNQMRFTITAPFKKMEDLQELNELLATSKFDKYFDQAFKMSGIDGMDEEGETEGKEEDPSSNIFGSLFPDYFKCQYKKGLIDCKTDPVKVEAFRARWKPKSEDDESANKQMMKMVSFTNRINIPSNAKKVTGEMLQEGASRKEWIQKGDLLDLFENPTKYEYSIAY